MSGNLYIVATPIGNLSDITHRAIETLKSVSLILAEDTRVTRKLLTHYDIDTPLDNYHQHSSENKMYDILRRLIEGENIALVTDAGTPGISDPGNELISFLVKHEPSIKITPIPGASSLTAALSISGMDVSHFTFISFLPKKKQTKLFETLKASGMPFVYFDSPHRVLKNLETVKNYFGEVDVFVGRELTKMFEETYRGPISQVIQKLQESDPRGEVVVIVNI